MYLSTDHAIHVSKALHLSTAFGMCVSAAYAQVYTVPITHWHAIRPRSSHLAHACHALDTCWQQHPLSAAQNPVPKTQCPCHAVPTHLLARQMSFPALIAATVGSSPAQPTMPVTTASASGWRATSTAPSSPTRISGWTGAPLIIPLNCHQGKEGNRLTDM